MWCAGAFEGHVGKEQLLAVLVRPGEVEGSARLLQHPGLLDAEPAGALVGDPALAVTVGADTPRVVGPPPDARGAQPAPLPIHAPGQTAPASAEVVGATGMAAVAKALAEVRARAAPLARRRRERTAGHADVAVLHARPGPRRQIGRASCRERGCQKV